MVQPPLNSHNFDGQSTQMKRVAGCEDGLPGSRPSLKDTNQLPDTEAWLLEVLSAERKKDNKAQIGARGAGATAENSGPRELSYPTEGEGKGAGACACALEGTSQQVPTAARTLATPGPGLSTPTPVLVETWDGLQAAQFNYVDVEQAKRALPLSLSPHPNPPSYLAACRGNLPGAMPLQGAMWSSTDDNDDQLQNALAMEERDFADIARGFGILRDAERKGLFSWVVELCQEVLVGDRFDSSPMSVDTVMLAMNLFGIYIGVTNAGSLDALPQEELELLPGVCLLAAFKFDKDVCNILPKLVSVLAGEDEGSWEYVKKQVSSLEWKMLRQTDFRLTTPTAATFIHLFLEHAVSEGALAQQDTFAVGAEATEIAWEWVAKGFIVEVLPSELAVAAIYCAAFCKHGPATAANVAAVSGCVLECPRFQELCLEAKYSSRGTTDSAGAGVFTGADAESSHKKNLGGEVGSILAGESDTDGVTPLPSANIQEKNEAFFHEGQGPISRPPQAGHDETFPISQGASMQKPRRDLGNEGQILIAPPDDPKERRAPARTIGHGGQAVASCSARNSQGLWGNRVDVRATPPPIVEPRQPARELERTHLPLNDDCSPTELVTLHTVTEESRNALVDVAACPTPPATAALLCGVHGRPGACNSDGGRSADRPSPIQILRSVNGARGAGFDGVFSPRTRQSAQRVEDDVGVGACGSGASTGRPLIEVDVQSQVQSRLALSRRKAEAETTARHDVDGESAADSSGVDVSLGGAEEELRVLISPSVGPVRLASEARLPPVGDPRHDQRVQHARFGGGGRSGERGRGDGSTNGKLFAIQSSSPSRRLLAPADVWSDDEGDWLRMTTRDLRAAGEVLRRVEHELAAQRKLGQLSWTRGGLLVPRDSCGGCVRRRERE